MKVLNKSELHAGKTAKTVTANGTETVGNTTDLTKYRKKKKQSKNLVKLIIALVAVIAFAIVWLNADTIFEPLRGIASKVETKTSYDVGFPIELPGSSEYTLERFGDNFALLTDTYLYAYDKSGGQLYALKHGYNSPEISTNEKRILLFDKSGYTFALYSRSSLIYQKTLEDKIIYTCVGSDNLAAVVTDSSRYSNVLYIYDDGGNWRYTRKFADENVMQVSFVGDGEHIIVSTISSANGDIVTNFYKLSIKSTEGSVWYRSLKNNSLPCGLYADKSCVLCVCDNAVISLDTATGSTNTVHTYSGGLQHFSICGLGCALHCLDVSSGRNTLTVLNSSAEETAYGFVSSGTSCLTFDEDGIVLLEGTRLRIYDAELENENEMALVNDDHTKFVKIGRDLFLLGYDKINTVNITVGLPAVTTAAEG
ncbi:MAG: hypothetical protein IJT87_02230 [Ruminiclostridium sp.]|nr:hypothetical protein [Ruminiclostridium sp.]